MSELSSTSTRPDHFIGRAEFPHRLCGTRVQRDNALRVRIKRNPFQSHLCGLPQMCTSNSNRQLGDRDSLSVQLGGELGLRSFEDRDTLTKADLAGRRSTLGFVFPRERTPK